MRKLAAIFFVDVALTGFSAAQADSGPADSKFTAFKIPLDYLFGMNMGGL